MGKNTSVSLGDHEEKVGEPAPVYGHAVGHTTSERHQPEQPLLYQLIEAHYPALVDQLAQQGEALPDHVHREFEAYLKCGRLEHRFLRVDTIANASLRDFGPRLQTNLQRKK